MTLVQNPANFAIEDVPDQFSEVNSLITDVNKVSSTTLVTVPQLVIPYGPSQRFLFRYQLFYVTNATADFKYRLALPASASLWRNVREELAPAATAWVNSLDAGNNGTTDFAVLAASGTDGAVRGSGIFIAPASAGSLTIQFAQNTSNAGQTSVRAGSYLEYKQY
jgi:hypothetical protein